MAVAAQSVAGLKNQAKKERLENQPSQSKSLEFIAEPFERSTALGGLGGLGAFRHGALGNALIMRFVFDGENFAALAFPPTPFRFFRACRSGEAEGEKGGGESKKLKLFHTRVLRLRKNRTREDHNGFTVFHQRFTDQREKFFIRPTRSAGSRWVLNRLTPQCKCGPVVRPVLPTMPMGVPLVTRWPWLTRISSM